MLEERCCCFVLELELEVNLDRERWDEEIEIEFIDEVGSRFTNDEVLEKVEELVLDILVLSIPFIPPPTVKLSTSDESKLTTTGVVGGGGKGFTTIDLTGNFSNILLNQFFSKNSSSSLGNLKVLEFSCKWFRNKEEEEEGEVVVVVGEGIIKSEIGIGIKFLDSIPIPLSLSDPCDIVWDDLDLGNELELEVVEVEGKTKNDRRIVGFSSGVEAVKVIEEEVIEG